jgi:hypothetical protein
MRLKSIIGLLFLLFAGYAGLAGTVVKVYEFGPPEISNSLNYTVISFPGTRLLGETGKATLPFFPVKLLLPPGEIAIAVSIEFDNPVTLKGRYELLPRQETRPISEGGNGEWFMDDAFYNSSREYPSRLKYEVETQFYNGSGIALSAFTPLRYIPSKGEVLYYQVVRVTVQTAHDPLSNEHLGNFFPSREKSGALDEIIQNPEQISAYYSGRELRTNDYNYLIITPTQYTSEFDTLASFYKPRGILTKITSTAFIGSNYTGADLQEKIRKYVKDEYQVHGIGYVLIGGDAELVPYRGFYCYVQSGGGYSDYGIPSDLYYSALDGNWNTDGDSKWAEPDEDDLLPEVAIGRMTFSDTAELHNMLHKTMLYQANPVEGELTRPLLAGEHLWSQPLTWGSDYLRLLVGYRTNNGYSTHGIPPAQPRDTLYDQYANWTQDTLRSHINAGRPWLHHVGHANYTYAMKMYNSDITNANFAGANGVNHNYTIVYTHGCNCGGYDVDDCIAERMVGIDNFAVAFVGNSRYGWFNEGTTDGPSEHLHREFMDALYYDSLYHIGMAHLKSKLETAPFVEVSGEYEPGATRWCFYDNYVLGDPMMAMWTEEPYVPQVSYPPLIPIGADSVVVQVIRPQGGCHNFTCSIYYNDTLFGTATTNAAGKAVIMLQSNLNERPLSLVVSGYNILPQYFQVHVSDYWLGYSDDWNKGFNWLSGTVPDSSTYIIIPANPAGTHFPVYNSARERNCSEIRFEPGSHFIIRKDETFSIGDN